VIGIWTIFCLCFWFEQKANMLMAEYMWRHLEKYLPHYLGEINPHNEKIVEIFGDQGGYWEAVVHLSVAWLLDIKYQTNTTDVQGWRLVFVNFIHTCIWSFILIYFQYPSTAVHSVYQWPSCFTPPCINHGRARLRPNWAWCCSSGVAWAKGRGPRHVDPLPLHFPSLYPFLPLLLLRSRHP